MSYKQKARLIAFIISFIYIVIGTIRLLSMIENNNVFEKLGPTFDSIILPAYIIGFGLTFASGLGSAFIGQIIIFGLIYFILYLLILFAFKLLAKKDSN